MKTFTMGIVSAAILMVLAGVGSGIALAGGDYTDSQAMCCADQEALEQGASSRPYTEDRPVLSFGDEMQLRNPVETGAIPAMVSEESWMKDYGND